MKQEKAENMELIRYVDALRDACEHEMSRDEKVFLFGLDVDDHKAIQGSTEGLLKKFGKDRVFGTPLSEDAMSGVAIGAAMAGFRPIHVHIRMDFLLLCMNQLINMAAKAHYMYNGTVKVPLVIRAMIGRSWGQGAQHSQALHSLFMHIPGLKIVAPSNAHDAKGLMISAIRDDNPVIFMEHRLLCNNEAYVPTDAYSIPIGSARIVEEGSDITVVAISHMVIEALRATNKLTEHDINIELIDPRSLKPLDIPTILKSVKKTKNLLVVDNGWLGCGAGAEIINLILEELQKEGDLSGYKFQRMGFAETTCPTTRNLENLFYPNAKTISGKVIEMLGRDDIDANKFDFEQTEIDNFKGPF